MTTVQAAAGGSRVPVGKTTWLAWSLCAVSLALMALSVVLIVLGRTASYPASPTEWTAASWAEQIAGIVGALGAPILGALIASHRPGNRYGCCGARLGWLRRSTRQRPPTRSMRCWWHRAGCRVALPLPGWPAASPGSSKG